MHCYSSSPTNSTKRRYRDIVKGYLLILGLSIFLLKTSYYSCFLLGSFISIQFLGSCASKGRFTCFSIDNFIKVLLITLLLFWEKKSDFTNMTYIVLERDWFGSSYTGKVQYAINLFFKCYQKDWYMIWYKIYGFFDNFLIIVLL